MSAKLSNELRAAAADMREMGESQTVVTCALLETAASRIDEQALALVEARTLLAARLLDHDKTIAAALPGSTCWCALCIPSRSWLAAHPEAKA